ncbi:MAG: N-acetylmuramoyl-L-alanine amidase family protein [Bacteroidota bacterium]
MKSKTISRNLFLIVILLVAYPALAQMDPNKKITIVIDPGHGGKDSGAKGYNDLKEKDITLILGLEILNLNSKQNLLEIYLTRTTDTLISLHDRSKLAKALKPDLFISLHLNHSLNESATGTEVFVARTQLTENLKESIFIANEIHNSLTSTLGFKARGVKFANFQVLRETIQFVPSILVEFCFISNKDEAQYLSENSNLKALAFSILNSLTKIPEL